MTITLTYKVRPKRKFMSPFRHILSVYRFQTCYQGYSSVKVGC